MVRQFLESRSVLLEAVSEACITFGYITAWPTRKRYLSCSVFVNRCA